MFSALELKIPGSEPVRDWLTPEKMANGSDDQQEQLCRLLHTLHRAGIAKAEIARRLKIGRTSVRRILTPKEG